MIFSENDIRNWLPIFEAFLDPSKEILTTNRMMYPKKDVDVNDIDSEYRDDEGNDYVTKKSDWLPIDKNLGLSIIRSNRTIVNPSVWYRIADKESEHD